MIYPYFSIPAAALPTFTIPAIESEEDRDVRLVDEFIARNGDRPWSSYRSLREVMAEQGWEE